MATKLGKIVADFRTTLATELAVGGTSATLQSATDSDGNALPSGTYYFTLDKEGSQKEHIVCSLSGTAITSISTVSRQGVQASGAVRKHRIGASVEITDFAHIMYMNDLLAGTTDLNASVPLKYDGTATLTPGSNQLATVAYADALTFAGAPNGSTTQKGIFEEATVAEQGTATATGSTGARLTLACANLVKTSSGAGDENKIAVLDASGTFANGFIDKARTWSTVQSFTANNAQITTDADSSNDAVRKSLLDSTVSKGAVSGTSGEAISVGHGVYLKASDSKYYKTIGTGDESTFSFCGVALTATAGADESFTFAPPGHIVATTGLTAGSYYFVSDTAGTLATTPGTRFARVGFAVSTTSLLVTLPKFVSKGGTSITGTGNTVITTGFYPAHVTIRMGNNALGGVIGSISVGDDSNTCVRSEDTANQAGFDGSNAWSFRYGTTNGNLGTVSAKSATGFTLNCNTYLNPVSVYWVAFSE